MCTCKLGNDEIRVYIVKIMEWSHSIASQVNRDGGKIA